MIAQFRGLATVEGIDVSDLAPTSPLLLRDFILRATFAMLNNVGPENFGMMDKATYDPTGAAKDAFAMANMVEGANAKVMTAAEHTKLAGIASAATVTNASTVGAAIAGVSQVAAPADGDRFSGVPSGASTLFWTTWGNIKAALKTYFDTLYATVGHTHTFASLTSKPTTRSGYGITDAASSAQGTLADGALQRSAAR
jgi:hypothetical protein